MKEIMFSILISMPCFGCLKCNEIEYEVLSKITQIVQEYNQDHDDYGAFEQAILTAKLQPYIELHEKFFKQDYSSLNLCD